MIERPLNSDGPGLEAPAKRTSWWRGINFARPRYPNIVILLGLVAFWVGVILKIFS